MPDQRRYPGRVVALAVVLLLPGVLRHGGADGVPLRFPGTSPPGGPGPGGSSLAVVGLQESGLLALVNGTVLKGDGTDPIRDGVVLIRGDRIQAVGAAGEIRIPGDARVLDAQGGTIMPGLFNAHVHHGASPEVRRGFLEEGVTSVCDLGSPWEEVTGYRETTWEGSPVARGFFAGPIVTAPGGYPDGLYHTRGFNYEVVGEEAAREAVRVLVDRGVHFVKVALDPSWNREDPLPMLEVAEARALVEEAHTHGLGVRAHMIQIPYFPMAIEAGIDVIEHMPFPTGWPPVDKIQELMEGDDPFSYFFQEWHPQYDTLLAHLAGDGIVLVPTMAALLGDLYGKDDPTLRERYVVGAVLEIVRRFRDAGGVVALGNDYNGRSGKERLPMTEIRALLDAGMTPQEVVEAGTGNAARVCGQEKELGVLHPGMKADLLVLEGDFLTDVEAIHRLGWVILDGSPVEGIGRGVPSSGAETHENS